MAPLTCSLENRLRQRAWAFAAAVGYLSHISLAGKCGRGPGQSSLEMSPRTGLARRLPWLGKRQGDLGPAQGSATVFFFLPPPRPPCPPPAPPPRRPPPPRRWSSPERRDVPRTGHQASCLVLRVTPAPSLLNDNIRPLMKLNRRGLSSPSEVLWS